MTAGVRSWTLPHRSQRQPVLGDDVIATSQPLATQAGMRAFERGGNAVDAALAAAIALVVVEPTSNGIGGDAMAVVAEPDGAVHGLNASGRSPAGLDVERLLERDRLPMFGWDTVTVPGAVSAWAALNQRFGRLPLEELAEPAVRYARHGFPVAPLTAAAWEHARQAFGHREAFAATFLLDGRAPRAGERFACPEQATSLEAIAASGGEAFYRGELAERIVAHAQADGGALAAADLAEHVPRWVEPLTVAFAGMTARELPPNTQGLAAAVALGVLERTDHRELQPDGAASTHLVIEAVKLGLADAHRHVGDPSVTARSGAPDRAEGEAPPVDADIDRLLEPSRLDELAGRIDPDRAGDPGHGRPWPGGTVYLAAADREGMVVSYIQSNYVSFGSGVVVPGTGIALHNRGACFVREEGHPNRVAAGTRPYHTIIPGLLTDGSDPFAAFGVMGGPMQPQGHAQVLGHWLAHGANPQAAVDTPRWRVGTGREVHLEGGISEEVAAGLRDRGHDIHDEERWDEQFGGAQIAARSSGGGWLGASDPRKDGYAAAR